MIFVVKCLSKNNKLMLPINSEEEFQSYKFTRFVNCLSFDAKQIEDAVASVNEGEIVCLSHTSRAAQEKKQSKTKHNKSIRKGVSWKTKTKRPSSNIRSHMFAKTKAFVTESMSKGKGMGGHGISS